MIEDTSTSTTDYEEAFFDLTTPTSSSSSYMEPVVQTAGDGGGYANPYAAYAIPDHGGYMEPQMTSTSGGGYEEPCVLDGYETPQNNAAGYYYSQVEVSLMSTVSFFLKKKKSFFLLV